MTLHSLFSRQVLAAETGSGSGGNSAPAASGTSQAPSAPSNSSPSSAGSGSSAASSIVTVPSQRASPASASPATKPPSADSAPADPTPAVGEAFDFSSIFESGGDTTPAPQEPVVAAPTATPVPPVPQPPVGAEPPKPAVESTAPVTPAAQAAPSPQDASQTQGPHLDPADPVSVAGQLAENESAIIDHLAGSMFKLTNEEVEALETDVVGTVPKLLAKAYVKAQHTMLSQMGRMIPQMIQRHAAVVERNTKNEGKFFARWPDLKADVHGTLVRTYGATYRAMHPQATLDEMIEHLGPMVMMAAKVVPSTNPGQPVAAAPLASVLPNGRPAQPAPFMPAVGGPGAPSTNEASNDWDVFSHQE